MNLTVTAFLRICSCLTYMEDALAGAQTHVKHIACPIVMCRCLIHGLLEREEAEEYVDEIKRKKGDLRYIVDAQSVCACACLCTVAFSITHKHSAVLIALTFAAVFNICPSVHVRRAQSLH